MQSNIPIKDRLGTKLKPADLMIVKHALIMYLAERDPSVQKNTLKYPLMINLLPFLKAVSNTWESMHPTDMKTTNTAVYTAYHYVRHQFRSLSTLRKCVQEYIKLDMYKKQPQDVPEAEVSIKLDDQLQSYNEVVTIQSEHNYSKSQSDQKKKPKLQQMRLSSTSLRQSKLSNLSNDTLQIIHKLVKSSPLHREYLLLRQQLKAKKRELKAAEKKMKDFQLKVIGVPSLSDDSE